MTHIDLKCVSLIYHKIRQKVPNGKGLMVHVYEYVIKIEQTLKNCEILGSKGELSETQITLHVEIEFACTF